MRAIAPTVGLLLLACPTLARAATPQVTTAEFNRVVQSGSRPELDRLISRIQFAGVPHERLAFAARMLAEGESRARQNAAYLFSVVRAPAFAGSLATALSDSDEIVRGYCATALGNLKARRAVPALVAVLDDPSPVVRRETAKALGSIGDKSATKPVIKLLDDTNNDVRVAAILALGNLGDKAAEKALLPLVKAPSETTRLAAVKSLCVLGSAEGKKPVQAMLASHEPGERIDGIRLLEGVKVGWARDALLAQMKDEDLNVAIAAARGLALAGDGRGVEWLVHSAPLVDPRVTLKIETVLEDLKLTSEDRKKILARKPSAGVVLPQVRAETSPDAP